MKLKQYLQEEYFTRTLHYEIFKDPDTIEMRRIGEMRLLIDNKSKTFFAFTADGTHFSVLQSLVKTDKNLGNIWFSAGTYVKEFKSTNGKISNPYNQLMIDLCFRYNENKQYKYEKGNIDSLDSFQWLIDKIKLISPNTPLKVYVGTEKKTINENESANKFQTGKPVTFTYLHIKEKAPNYGSRFGQDIEAAGKYVVVAYDDYLVKHFPNRYEMNTVTLKNPLVVINDEMEPLSYKYKLNKMYKGKTGKRLSDAIRKDGYDAIVSQDPNGDTREIVLLKP
jgi:hypothetical protein